MFEWISGAGQLIGGVGQAYGAIQQSKMANKMYDLQKSSYDRNVNKENKAQANLDAAVSNIYGTDDKKKKTNASFDLGGTNNGVL